MPLSLLHRGHAAARAGSAPRACIPLAQSRPVLTRRLRQVVDFFDVFDAIGGASPGGKTGAAQADNQPDAIDELFLSSSSQPLSLVGSHASHVLDANIAEVGVGARSFTQHSLRSSTSSWSEAWIS